MLLESKCYDDIEIIHHDDLSIIVGIPLVRMQKGFPVEPPELTLFGQDAKGFLDGTACVYIISPNQPAMTTFIDFSLCMEEINFVVAYVINVMRLGPYLHCLFIPHTPQLYAVISLSFL